MKKSIVCVLAGLLLTAGTASAEIFWTGDVGNPVGPTNPYQNILNFDWSSSGSGVAIGTGPFGTVTPQGKQFDFLYQAVLTGFTDPNGQEIATPNLNVTHEYSIVVKIPEIQVNAISPTFPRTAVFATDPNPPATSRGNAWAIYYDGVGVGGQQANVIAGTGFNDGLLIASGHLIPEITTAFTAISAGSGVGSTILHGLVDYFDVAFFGPDYVTGRSVFDIRFEGTVNYPPLDSVTQQFFDGNDGFAVYDTDPLARTDILFKVDGSSKFSVAVPEPSTFVLLGFGLLGIAGLGRKRMKK